MTRWRRSGSSSMTAHRSKSGLSIAIGVLVLTACAATHGSPSIARQPTRVHHPLERPPPSQDLVGRLAFRDARAEDTLVDLGPELGVGYTELVAANPGVDPWLPKEG